MFDAINFKILHSHETQLSLSSEPAVSCPRYTKKTVTSVDEVIHEIKEARDHERIVRVRGSEHSPADHIMDRDENGMFNYCKFVNQAACAGEDFLLTFVVFNFKYKKTEYMLIGSRQRLKDIQIDPKITLGDTEVNRVSKKKPWGLWLMMSFFGEIMWTLQLPRFQKESV